jgi:hypothetical protein
MCRCSDLGDYKEIWDDNKSFTVGFAVVGHRGDVELRRCETCGTYWQVDVGRGGLAIRVTHPDQWDSFDDRPVRLRQLVDFHGGVAEGKCAWKGCERKPLKGMAFCPHHAYPMLSAELSEGGTGSL